MDRIVVVTGVMKLGVAGTLGQTLLPRSGNDIFVTTYHIPVSPANGVPLTGPRLFRRVGLNTAFSHSDKPQSSLRTRFATWISSQLRC
jgi:hypothetical protein